MCFGVGELLARRFGPDEMRVLPAPSVISLVCARLGWSRAEVEAISLHGRPQGALHRHLVPGARLVVLSQDGETPNQIAALLCARGFGPSRLFALRARRRRGRAAHRGERRELAAGEPRGAQHARDRLRGRARGHDPCDRARAAGRGVPLRWHADQARGAGGDARPAHAAAGPVPLGRRRRQRRGRDRVAARDPARARGRDRARRRALRADRRERAGAGHARARAPAGRGTRLPRRACRRRMRSSSAAAPACPACSMPAGRPLRRAAAWSPTWSRSRASRRSSPGRRATAASWSGSRSPASTGSAPTTAGGRHVPVTQLAALKP